MGKENTCCFTGHRVLNSDFSADLLRRGINYLIGLGVDTFICGGALGFDTCCAQAVLDAKPDIIITAAFGQFIPKVILDYPKLGCINVHGSLLPKYRGAAPIQWAVLNGDKTTDISRLCKKDVIKRVCKLFK